jgi:hypothetical protein
MMATIPIASLTKQGREHLRVGLVVRGARRLLDLRAFEDFTAAGVAMPTARGVTVNVELIPELVEALHQAEDAARSAGWIGGEP